jgi:uncharacterized protein
MPIQPDLEYYAHLASGRFMLPADNFGKPFFPPRATVPGTASEKVHWVEASGRGTIYSATTVHRKPPEENYNVALIELVEGPRMMSRVEDIDPADVRIGMPVVVRIITPEPGTPFVVFIPERPE